MSYATRHSERLTITLPWAVLHQLQQRALTDGRSVSNLAAYLIERSLTGSAYGEPQ